MVELFAAVSGGRKEWDGEGVRMLWVGDKRGEGGKREGRKT